MSPDSITPKSVTPEIVVELELLPTSEGGRMGPILAGEYHGVACVGDDCYSMRFLTPEGETVGPGRKKVLGFQFLFPEHALQCFKSGTQFVLREDRVIGNGKVLEVLDEKPGNPQGPTARSEPVMGSTSDELPLKNMGRFTDFWFLYAMPVVPAGIASFFVLFAAFSVTNSVPVLRLICGVNFLVGYAWMHLSLRKSGLIYKGHVFVRKR